MTKEGLIKRMKGKTGKGGFSMFLLTESVKQAVIEYKSKINIRSIEENNNISNNLKNKQKVNKNVSFNTIKNNIMDLMLDEDILIDDLIQRVYEIFMLNPTQERI